ncbi:MAG: bifunctional DNA-formamidopyrimidine glycosylase/DNA-(apurinic or apyrimidinic site) lyase [Acidimicrobiales bacterium]|nr:bifunctional DNA-formamidopyrimidine glycosylase/DNA-(apurinic or apyrimidinic site) lyase [Acidimicrobiales bacterium]
MPELPEVETVKRGLASIVTDRRVEMAGSHPSIKFSPATTVVGARFNGVNRRGKYLLFPLDDGRQLVAHLGMTGQFRPVSEPSSSAHVRAWWRLDDGTILEFRDVRRFGRIAVVQGDDYSSLPTLHALGPEPFDPDFDGLYLWKALRSSSAAIKTQLLSQKVVAGVGNIYADEALWRAHLHPDARRITKAKAEALRIAIINVLKEGIENGGTTLRDYRSVDGSEGSNQHSLDCYGQAGSPCPRCSTVMVRSVIGARATTHCPSCQKR